LRWLAADPAIAQALRETRSAYQHTCLIHGDLRCDNWIMHRSGPHPELRILDWEMSGAGDPAWGIGSAIAELIVDAVRAGAGPAHGAGAWLERVRPTLQTLLAAYGAAGGPLAAEVGDPWWRVVSCTAARLLHVASESAEYEANAGSSPLAALVAQARALIMTRRAAGAKTEPA
jgi:hypothetical protein